MHACLPQKSYGSGYDVVLLANGSNTIADAAYPRFVLAARIHNVLNPGAPEPVQALPPSGGVIAWPRRRSCWVFASRGGPQLSLVRARLCLHNGA